MPAVRRGRMRHAVAGGVQQRERQFVCCGRPVRLEAGRGAGVRVPEYGYRIVAGAFAFCRIGRPSVGRMRFARVGRDGTDARFAGVCRTCIRSVSAGRGCGCGRLPRVPLACCADAGRGVSFRGRTPGAGTRARAAGRWNRDNENRKWGKINTAGSRRT